MTLEFTLLLVSLDVVFCCARFGEAWISSFRLASILLAGLPGKV